MKEQNSIYIDPLPTTKAGLTREEMETTKAGLMQIVLVPIIIGLGIVITVSLAQ